MVRIYNRGVSARVIGGLYDCDARAVLGALRRAGVQIQQAGQAQRGGRDESLRCCRCEILLAEAIPGADGMCGYCVEERG